MVGDPTHPSTSSTWMQPMSGISFSPEIPNLLENLYGPTRGPRVQTALLEILEAFPVRLRKSVPGMPFHLTERDSLLITYADQLSERGVPPLETLTEFCEEQLAGVTSGIHLLPFFPSSSDDGFSVIDYRQVDPALGCWKDIRRLRRNFHLMFDAVLNHVSAESGWVKRFQQGDPRFQEHFIQVTKNLDLSQVARPRTSPLATELETVSGPRQVWTTFSADQIDLNYANPQVLLEMIDVVLFYVAQGADLIRLDAAAYLWKQSGTSCIHLPQTHGIIQLLRAVLNQASPGVKLVTETNVPHQENISYFGDGKNEAQLVYNFALPPLILHTFHTSNAGRLAAWAGGLKLPSREVTFLNFLASHDGIGLNPVRGILTDLEIDRLVKQTISHGGLVSYKKNTDGTESPYELNINFFDALSDPEGGEAQKVQVDRFSAAHALMFSLQGIPGIYFHSLFGSRGWREGADFSGKNRTINRQKFAREQFEGELKVSGSLRRQVFDRLTGLLRIRALQPAFDPSGESWVLETRGPFFAVVRTSPKGDSRVLCLQNVSAQNQSVHLHAPGSDPGLQDWTYDLIRAGRVDEKHGEIRLDPYQTAWLIKPA